MHTWHKRCCYHEGSFPRQGLPLFSSRAEHYDLSKGDVRERKGRRDRFMSRYWTALVFRYLYIGSLVAVLMEHIKVWRSAMALVQWVEVEQ